MLVEQLGKKKILCLGPARMSGSPGKVGTATKVYFSRGESELLPLNFLYRERISCYPLSSPSHANVHHCPTYRDKIHAAFFSIMYASNKWSFPYRPLKALYGLLYCSVSIKLYTQFAVYHWPADQLCSVNSIPLH